MRSKKEISGSIRLKKKWMKRKESIYGDPLPITEIKGLETICSSTIGLARKKYQFKVNGKNWPEKFNHSFLFSGASLPPTRTRWA